MYINFRSARALNYTHKLYNEDVITCDICLNTRYTSLKRKTALQLANNFAYSIVGIFLVDFLFIQPDFMRLVTPISGGP